VRRPPLPSLTYRPAWLPDCGGARIAVVGADGFIGSHVVVAALGAGATVTAVCVREHWRLEHIRHGRLELVRRRDWQSFEPPVSGAVALLAYEPPPTYDMGEWRSHEREVNAAGALEVARRSRGRFVFASSADVYGPWHDDPVSEDIRPQPATPYAEAKLAVEDALTGRNASVALRIATVYGPSEHERRAVPAFIRALSRGDEVVIHGDGSDIRDYVYVGDVAGAVVACCVNEGVPPVLNIGSGVGRRTIDVLGSVASVLGVEPRLRFERSPRPSSRLVLDTSSAAEDFGYQSRDDFEAALAEETGWLLARPSTPS
jgi:UDP-glucose 4-epimerase